MKKYYLLQLPSTHPAVFRSWGDLPEDKKPTIDDYVPVWCDDAATEITDEILLEHLFTKFNSVMPANYAARSMSVSDVIVITETGKESKYFYCSSFGWDNVTNLLTERENDGE